MGICKKYIKFIALRKGGEVKTKFINFEGIHGCGKSTTAWILNEKMCQEGINSKLFLEVDMDYAQKNPCDI